MSRRFDAQVAELDLLALVAASDVAVADLRSYLAELDTAISGDASQDGELPDLRATLERLLRALEFLADKARTARMEEAP